MKRLPKDFKAAGLSCGIKASGKKDLGLIVSNLPCQASGVFTMNSVKAHCVIDNMQTLASDKPIQAIIVNSGNANACTGQLGLEALIKVKQATSRICNCMFDGILSASTGVIGVPLPSNLIVEALPRLKDSLSDEVGDFADAILTTDLKTKVAFKQLDNYSLVGIAKGSGMIHPQMATMLAFILTDCKLSQPQLQQALQIANSRSFNQISVDGNMSTNDMVLLLANASTGYEPDLMSFTQALIEVSIDLAKQIVRDGEGATKIFEVKVKGSLAENELARMAKGIASSTLVKSAIFGNDPNWGRLLAAAGQHGKVNTQEASVQIFDMGLMERGQVLPFDKTQLVRRMKESQEIPICVSVDSTENNLALAWGCDLTYDYVRINAEYTT